MNVVIVFADLIVRLSLGLAHAQVSLLFRERLHWLKSYLLFPFLRFWLFVNRFLENWLLFACCLPLDVCFIWFWVLSLFVEFVPFDDSRIFLKWVMVVFYIMLKPYFHIFESSIQIADLPTFFPFLFNPFHLKLYFLLKLKWVNFKT